MRIELICLDGCWCKFFIQGNLIAALLSLAVVTAVPKAALSIEANEGLEEHIVTAPLPRGAEIRGLVSKRIGSTPDRIALLFVGSPGLLHLRDENGTPNFDVKGNFLARARRHLNDDSVMTVLVDCPTDEWDGCDATYRRSAQYAEDITALISALLKELGPKPVYVVGTSFGTVSSANLARRLGSSLAGAVHTATFAGTSQHAFESGMSGFDWEQATVPQVFVHHIGDPCPVTPYREIKSSIGGLPLMSVRGASDTSGPACQAFSEHGFRGREEAVMRAIAAWITHGTVTPLVGEP